MVARKQGWKKRGGPNITPKVTLNRSRASRAENIPVIILQSSNSPA